MSSLIINFELTDKTNSAKGFDLWYIRMLLTILFPPFGIFMSKGLKGMGQILICSALTACFYFPGLIYAINDIGCRAKQRLSEKQLEKAMGN